MGMMAEGRALACHTGMGEHEEAADYVGVFPGGGAVLSLSL